MIPGDRREENAASTGDLCCSVRRGSGPRKQPAQPARKGPAPPAEEGEGRGQEDPADDCGVDDDSHRHPTPIILYSIAPGS